jgi:hypothetical protein
MGSDGSRSPGLYKTHYHEEHRIPWLRFVYRTNSTARFVHLIPSLNNHFALKLTKTKVFWNMTQCRLVYSYQYFGGACCLHVRVVPKTWYMYTDLHDVTEIVTSSDTINNFNRTPFRNFSYMVGQAITAVALGQKRLDTPDVDATYSPSVTTVCLNNNKHTGNGLTCNKSYSPRSRVRHGSRSWPN